MYLIYGQGPPLLSRVPPGEHLPDGGRSPPGHQQVAEAQLPQRQQQDHL